MLKRTCKKLITAGLALALCASLLTGCGGINPDKTVMKVGDEKVTLGLANFYVRYQQGPYETYYGISEDGWSQNATEDETYEETLKRDSLDTLKALYLERQHMGDYKVELTKDEKKSIKEAAKAFMKDNDKKAKEATTASQDTVEEFLELQTIQHKVEEAIQDKADPKVTDEEAAQKKMQYVMFAFSSTDKDGNVTLMEDDEKKQVQVQAAKFAKDAADQKDFKAYAEKQGQTAEEVTFDKETSEPDPALIAAAVKLKKGQVSDVIEGENGYYVAKLTSDLDREATDQKKEELLSQRKQEAVDKQIKKWKKATKIKVYKRRWNKINLSKQGIKVKAEEAADGADAGAATE